MKEITLMIRRKAMVFILGQMEEDMKVIIIYLNNYNTELWIYALLH
jgi:hypothetical protein